MRHFKTYGAEIKRGAGRMVLTFISYFFPWTQPQNNKKIYIYKERERKNVV